MTKQGIARHKEIKPLIYIGKLKAINMLLKININKYQCNARPDAPKDYDEFINQLQTYMEEHNQQLFTKKTINKVKSIVLRRLDHWMRTRAIKDIY